MFSRKQALEYHSRGRKGKLQVVPTKPCVTQVDLSLACTPGVAEPCREIERNPDDVYEYTQRGNLVAVVTNGTAVLGLGDIGPLAAKPVMEGKGVLFKRFADIDTYDIEIADTDPGRLVQTVRMLEPTFGGINIEDIEAPECFEIEERLKALEIVGTDPDSKRIAGMFMLVDGDGHARFFADCLANESPDTEELADVAIQAADTVAGLGIEPREVLPLQRSRRRRQRAHLPGPAVGGHRVPAHLGAAQPSPTAPVWTRS